MSSRNPNAATAFYQTQQQLQAVEIRRYGQGFELLWQRETSLAEETWTAFAERSGVRLAESETGKVRRGKPVIVGFPSVGVTSYRLELPVVGEHQLADMIRMQSEARLPLPLEQMELGWRRLSAPVGKTQVTVAAARRQRVTSLLRNIKPLQPQTLCLDSEALVALALALGEGMPRDGFLLNLGDHVSTLCRLEAGQLAQMAIIDVGRDDLLTGVSNVQTAVLEQFIQDLEQAVTGMMDGRETTEPLYLLSGGGVGEAVLAETITQEGQPVRLCVLQWDRFRNSASLDTEMLWRQRIPIGLALHSLTAENTRGLFHHVCHVKETREVTGPACSLGSAVALLVLAAVALGAAVDVSYRIKARYLKERHETAKVANHVQERDLQKTLAQYRPDLLDLLTQLNHEDHKDIIIDGVHFERGQPIRVTGHTKKAEQMYAFEEKLLERSGVKTVSLEKEAYDKKAKVYNFTMLVHYKNFTKKTGAR